MALKKLSTAVEKTTEKKSSMRTIKTAGSLSDTISQVADLKGKIAEHEKEIKGLKAQLDPRAEEVKGEAVSNMIDEGSYDSVQLTSSDGSSAVGVIMMDKYNTIKGETEQLVQDVTKIVGEDNVDKFLDYQNTVRSEAIENEKVWSEFEKFAADMKKKHNVSLIEQQLKVKSGAIKNLKVIKKKEDIQALISILKPQINLTLK